MRNLLTNMRGRRWGAWNCAVYALLTVIGFVTLNVAGCGGGGGTGAGGGNRVNVTLTFRNIAGNRVDATGTVTNGTTTVNFTTTNGDAVISNIPPGNFTVAGTSNGVGFSQDITVGTDQGQNIQIIPGQSGSGTLVTGRMFLNRGDPTTGRCTNPGADTALTARVLIRARNRNTGLIVASFVREQQSSTTPDDQKGTFAILLPAGAYTIEVRQAPPVSSTEASAPFTGNSGIFNVPATTNVTICVNEGTTAPNGTPTPTASAVPTATLSPGPTNTPNPNATNTPLPTATNTPRPTNTPTPTPGGPGPLPSFTPAPTFTPTPIGGGGNPTPTNTGGPPPPPFLQHGKSVKKSANR